MNCIKCSSDRILSVNAKCSDRCIFNFGDHEYDGYVPEDCGIGGGDYVYFKVCLDCGQMQGKWPLPKSELELEWEEAEKDPFKKGDYVEYVENRTTFVGVVESYNRNLEEVEITSHGIWDFKNNCLDSICRFNHNPKRVKKSIEDVKKTNLEW
jgi:hypothetical protein